jgi:hypothetical protein
MTAIQLPLSERVLDRLADILFASDEILDMIQTVDRLPDDTTRDVQRSVRRLRSDQRAHEEARRLKSVLSPEC